MKPQEAPRGHTPPLDDVLNRSLMDCKQKVSHQFVRLTVMISRISSDVFFFLILKWLFVFFIKQQQKNNKQDIKQETTLSENRMCFAGHPVSQARGHQRAVGPGFSLPPWCAPGLRSLAS